MQPKFGVILDMDGVMVDSNPAHKISLREFCNRYGFTLSEQDLQQKIYGRTNANWISNLFGTLAPETLKAYAEEKESLFRELYEPHICAVEGLVEFLQQLRQAFIPCAIGTSAPPANVAFVLEHTKTEGFFEAIIDDSQISHSKPHPEVYLKAAAALGLEPSRCVVFEDSLSGVAAGLAAGCAVIGISTTHSPEELSACRAVLPDFRQAWQKVLEIMQ